MNVLRAKQELGAWWDAMLGFFYPNVCQVCGEERAEARDGYVGAQCWQTIRFIREPFCDKCGLPFEGEITTEFECANCRELDLSFDYARAAVAAKGVVLEVIHRYKYKRALWFEPFLAQLLVQEIQRDAKAMQSDLIVPVPLHPLKRREREFNQAERLGRALSSATGIRIATDLIERVAATETQTLLSRTERSRNVRRAFAMRPGKRLHGEQVLLVDDVLTTGATTSACAHLLRKRGAKSVVVWTVARGL